MRNRRFKLLLLFIVALAASATIINRGEATSALAGAGTIAEDETVIFFPTSSRLSDDGRAWTVPIHGWIFEPETDSLVRKATLKLLAKSLGLEEHAAEDETFQHRAAAFLVDNERSKRLSIRIGDEQFTLNESGPNGHFEATLTLPVETISRLEQDGHIENGWLRFYAVTGEDDARVFEGSVQLIGSQGISVISDIDDTIKISEVVDRSALLANTFLKPFRSVDGMAETYQRWAGRGAVFHYVSASPWQLYEPLTDWMRADGFPRGSMHLKIFRWKDSTFFDLFKSPEEIKPAAIEPILRASPQRRFILVGDSGEKDPEIYGSLAREHPEQVVRIFIRNVTNQGADAERYRRAFADVPAEKWQIFDKAEQLEAFDPASISNAAKTTSGSSGE